MSRNFIPTSFDFQLMRIVPEIKVSELHGRTIATAKVLKAKLITKGREIKKTGIVQIA
jgi:hypothetical protein